MKPGITRRTRTALPGFLFKTFSCLCLGMSATVAAPPIGDLPASTNAFPSTTPGGLTEGSLTVGGVTRDLLIYKPASAGASPPMLIFFSGTGATLGWNTADEMGRGAIVDFAETNGAVVVFPMPLTQTRGDWDNHDPGDIYWETATGDAPSSPPSSNPDTNPDLAFTRAIITEATSNTNYHVDPNRVFTNGFSNGAFFSYFAATVLRDRIAGFALTGGGLVLSNTTAGTPTQCDSLPFSGPPATRSCGSVGAGWTQGVTCVSAGAVARPIAPVTGMPPVYVEANDNDHDVPYPHACNLFANLPPGTPNEIRVVDAPGENGHFVNEGYLQRSWDFMINAGGGTPPDALFANGFES